MGWYEEQVVPRLVDVVLKRPEFAEVRQRVAAGLEGEVLELGFGSGLNLPFCPRSVSRVLAIDPSGVARRLANGRVRASGIPVEFAGLDGQALPLNDSSVDAVLSTWTLCTIPDPAAALGEVLRVLRPGGSLRFVEHGRSPNPRLAAWQDRLTPLQRRIAGGCHLNRQIDQLLTSSGLRLERLDNYYLKGPRVFTYMFEGVATKP